MNKTIRKRINELIEGLQSIRNEIEMIAEEEQEKFDNLPEGIQATERGENLEAAAEALQSGMDSIDEAIEYFQEAIAY